MAIYGGGAIYVHTTVGPSGVEIEQCSFTRNKAGISGEKWGGAIRVDGTARIKKCTFVDNISARGAALYVWPGGDSTWFERNIVAFNSSCGIIDSSFGLMTYSCKDFYMNTGGSIRGTGDSVSVDANTIFQDPLFCDTANLDLRISSYSPCDEDSSKCDLLIGRFDNACTRCCNSAGNVNNVGIVDLADLSALVSYLTYASPVPPCLEEANCNGVGIVDLSDLSRLQAYLTYGSPAPVCPPQNH